MTNVLVRKLENYAALDDEEKRLLDGLLATSYTVAAGAPLIRTGDKPRTIHLVQSGLACRFKITDGRRQILSYMLPGDFCDLYGFILDYVDHNLVAVRESTIVEIRPEQIEALTDRPSLKRALWWADLVNESILREWIVNLGARTATRRIGHFFCEMLFRMNAVGLAENGSCDLPLSQTYLAETLGLSLVHTNKSLQKLRLDNLVVFNQARLTIPDIAALAAFASFDPRYLHLVAATPPTGRP